MRAGQDIERAEGAEGPCLGDVLYGQAREAPVAESEWNTLVRRVAVGEPPALQGLYERAARLVYVLALRITGRRDSAEDVTVEVFADIWRRAWAYDPAEATVLGWIMNQARSRARAHSRLGEPQASPVAFEAIVPPQSLVLRLARRIAEDAHVDLEAPSAPEWHEPPWVEVAPAILCKLLATDEQRDRVSMLVRLEPGGEYPPHDHAAREELHLLEGELWIDGRKLEPGDYNRAEAPSGDQRVWSETGCACVLVTSTRDRLR